MPDWPHAPLHRLQERGIYFVTAGTYQKEHYYRSPQSLDHLEELLFQTADEHHVHLHAWALLSNHYHIIIEPDVSAMAVAFIRHLHSLAAREQNQVDGVEGRRVWFNYRDTQLTFERSYLARLKYVNENAVHHRIVSRATNYPWCSASWFEDHADTSFVKTVQRLKIDRVSVADDFVPCAPIR